MLESLFAAADYLSQGINLAWLALGVIVGIVFGSIPGLGGATAIALLLPLTFGMEPEQAIILMGGIMGAVSIGGSVSAILLNTPGTAPNAATCIDGYPLTRQGKAGLAIGAAATASSLGGILSLIILVMLLPVGRLGPDEPQIIFDGNVAEMEACRDRRVQQFINGEAGERLMELRASQVV